jgi:hypothetical protein
MPVTVSSRIGTMSELEEGTHGLEDSERRIGITGREGVHYILALGSA